MFFLTTSDSTFIFIIFFILITIFTFRTTNLYSLLVISEFFWITLYIFSLLIAIYFNNTQVVSLSLFFLMFSAVEISVGFSSILLYKSYNHTLKI